MSEKVSNVTNRVLRLVKPVSAIMTFGQRPLAAARAGGAQGVLNFYKDDIIPNWHPPTLEGFSNSLTGPLGMGIMNSLLGHGVKFVGDVAGVDVVKTIGGAIQDGGDGMAIGGLADLIVHASKYNPTSPISLNSRGRDGGFRRGKNVGGKSSSAPGRGVAHASVKSVRFA